MNDNPSGNVLADALSLDVGAADVTGAVFVVPADAPLPAELGAAATGSLLARLGPLDVESSDSFAVSPLASLELQQLTGAWRALVRARKVFVLTGLPGARYDVVFTSAARAIGLRSVDWPELVDTIARRRAAAQSLSDSKPFAKGEIGAALKRRGQPDPWAPAEPGLPTPEATDEDQAGA